MQISDKALFRHQAYIDGRWCDADSGETLAVLNPANGEKIADVRSEEHTSELQSH